MARLGQTLATVAALVAVFALGRLVSGGSEALFASHPAESTVIGSDGSARRSAADGKLDRLAWALGHVRIGTSEQPGATATRHETEDQKRERRRRIDAYIDEELGPGVPAAKRAALLRLNEEATGQTLENQSALVDGRISNEEFYELTHQEFVDGLEALRSIITDDEYRHMTHLEPGVDPFEAIRTGVGFAYADNAASSPAPPGSVAP